jgi:hypothetical protein
LIQFHVFKSTDPRDKIYSILGLAPGEVAAEDAVLTPDYRIAAETLYTNVARHLLTKDGDILILSETGLGIPRQLALPSWVPDWSWHYEGASFLEMAVEGKYHAAKGTKARVTANAEEPTVLRLQGKIVDSVAELGSVRRTPSTHGLGVFDYAEASVAWADEAASMMNNSERALNLFSSGDRRPSMLKEAFWRTLIANVCGPLPENSARKGTERGYEQWLDGMRTEAAAKKRLNPKLEPELENEEVYFSQASNTATRNRRFLITEEGYFGLTSPGTEVGDLVAVFLGSMIPYIIRERRDAGPDEKKYQLVGQAYHHGVTTNPPHLDDTVSIALF